MSPSMHRPLVALVVVAGLLLAGCGGSGLPLPPPPSTDTVTTTASGADSGDTGDATSTDADSSGFGQADDPTRFYALDESVRVVNLFVPKGSTQGGPIDVWATEQYSTDVKKLLTVPYGQASPYVRIQVPDPTGQVPTGEEADWQLNFYSSGANAADPSVADLDTQPGSYGQGQKLTMLIKNDSDSSDGAGLVTLSGAFGQSGPGLLPKLPSGQALLALSDAGVTSDVTGQAEVELSTVDGACARYLDNPDTGQLNDPKSFTGQVVTGGNVVAYVVGPGVPVRVTEVKTGEDLAPGCREQPLFPAFDPKLAAGQGDFALLYGPDLKTAKMLLVPIM